MKKLMIIGLVMMASSAWAGTPPKIVAGAFNHMFPGLKEEDVTWVKETADIWEAFFTKDGVAMSADFEKDGMWLQTETAITTKELPTGVSSGLKIDYADWELTEVNKIVSTEWGTEFSLHLKKGLVEVIVIFPEKMEESI